MLATNEGLKAMINELALATSKRRQKEKKEAPQLLTKILWTPEGCVLDDTKENYHRAYAWVKLVSFWGALRGEDAPWIEAKSITLDPSNGLRANLERTKTTGPGKSILKRPLFISHEAYFISKEWMSVGLDMWSAANMERENLCSHNPVTLSKANSPEIFFRSEATPRRPLYC